jgi:hypothetical protein
MGILSFIGLSPLLSTPKVASPWNGSGNLAAIAYADVFGLDSIPVTRAEAMTVPPVARARHLICDVLARYPMKAYKDGAELPNQPAWLSRTDGVTGPRMRNLWTLDDLIFTGYSVWTVRRGADGFPLSADRVPVEAWQFDMSGVVQVLDPNGAWQYPDANSIILISGPAEGLLYTAARTIRSYRKIETAWQSRVSMPLATTELRYTGDPNDVDQDAIDNARAKYADARKDPLGAIVVSPPGWELIDHAQNGFDLFENGRNSATLDIARFLNIPAVLLDASNTNASSVNYTSQQSSRSWYIDTTLRPWAMPFEERLSADDMVPRGTYVGFDLSELVIVPDPGTPTKELD